MLNKGELGDIILDSRAVFHRLWWICVGFDVVLGQSKQVQPALIRIQCQTTRNCVVRKSLCDASKGVQTINVSRLRFQLPFLLIQNVHHQNARVEKLELFQAFH
jgi:hypothetical protein